MFLFAKPKLAGDYSENVADVFSFDLASLRGSSDVDLLDRRLLLAPLRIDPRAYLQGVLTRLPTLTNQDDLDAQLPNCWKPALPVSPVRTIAPATAA